MWKFPRAAPNSPSSVMAAASYSQAVVAALAPVSLWHLGAARPLFCISGRLFGPSRSASLVCPVPGVLGRSGTRPAGSIRASYPTCKCEAACASQLRYPRRPSASVQKSKPSDTRARLPSQATGNVEAEQGTRPRLSPERSQQGSIMPPATAPRMSIERVPPTANNIWLP